jgi:hypothetical protein
VPGADGSERICGGLRGFRLGTAPDSLASRLVDLPCDGRREIEVDTGRGIEFVLNRGATLRLGQGRK